MRLYASSCRVRTHQQSQLLNILDTTVVELGIAEHEQGWARLPVSAQQIIVGASAGGAGAGAHSMLLLSRSLGSKMWWWRSYLHICIHNHEVQ